MFEYVYDVSCGAWSDIIRPNQAYFERTNLKSDEVISAIRDIIEEATQKMSYDAKFRYFRIERTLICGVFLINTKTIFHWINSEI